MAGIIDRLVYEVGYDVDKGSLDNAKKGISDIGKALKTVSKYAFTAGTAIAGFTSLLTSQITETDRLAQSVGTTSDITEAFGAEMKKIGLNQENFIDLMEEMNNKMGEMKGLGEFTAVEESLEILNLKFEDLQKLSPEKQFEAITKASLEMADSQKAVTAVDMLMGGEANKLIGSLRAQGLTYDEVIRKQQMYNFQTEESRAGAKQFYNALDDFMRVVGSLANYVAGELGGAISGLVTEFTEWATANKEVIATGINDFVKTLAMIFSSLWYVLRTIVSAVTYVTDAFGGMASVIRLLISAGIVFGILRIAKGIAIIGLSARKATLSLALLGKGLNMMKNFLLIGALVAIFEDLWSWISGNNSVMGQLVGTFDEWIVSFTEGLKQLGSIILEVLLSPLTAVTSVIDSIIRGINLVTGAGISEIGFDVSQLTGQVSLAELGAVAIGTTASPVSNQSVVNNSNSNTANVVVNASGNPQEIAQAVQTQLDRTFTGATNALQPKQK